MTHLLKLEDRLRVKEAIEARCIPDDMWLLLEKLFESNEVGHRRAADLAWELEELQEAWDEERELGSE